MNIFKKFYCRTFQTVFKIMIPILPYHEPKILESDEDTLNLFKEKQIKKVLLVTDKGISKLGLHISLIDTLKTGGVDVVLFDDVVANPTSENVENGLKVFKEVQAEAIIGFGGGSAMDCAKGIGARIARPKKSLKKMKGILKVGKKLPLIVAVPTTAGTGSETTLACVVVDSKTREKYAINDFPLIPKYAMLDPSLTLKLPQFVTATTGMDALTHSIEAYIGRSRTKKTGDCAKKSIKLIFDNLQKAYEDGSNLQARKNMLYASYLAGVSFTVSYVGYVHAVAHSLGGKYNVAHGLANAVILPYVLKKYGKSIYKSLWELGVYAGLFGKETPKEVGAKIFIEKIEEMNKLMNIPTSLDIIEEKDIKSLAKTAEKEANPLYPVPKLWTAKELEKIYYEVKNGSGTCY